jgi:hypothetical protein
MRIDTNKINNWKVATKTKSIKAKPLINLLVDRSVTSKFLVDTLEGKEPLGDGSVICIGESMDCWQQMPKKLLQKYNVVAIDNDGWMICEPRPDNAVNCFEVTNQILNDDVSYAVKPPDNEMYKAWEFFIIGLWGETTPFGKNTQWGMIGDFICQNPSDPTDVWVVRKKIFNNTYSVKS